ncbi:MAG: glycosyltransferase [Anaerohalosphaeraceae bacterium]|nr:glycosyltransferase [Anaerohalosphaeraceae bacterium]
MAPNVSICIPTYNRKDLLRETLASVFAQTYTDFEVVIVDDGSTDGTRQMLEEGGYDVRYHWQENAGDAAARNTLIKLAGGKYISFLDSDDLLFPSAIEKMVSVIPDDKDDVIVYGPYVAIDAAGSVLKRKKKKLYSGNITNYLFENILIHSCGSMFPKKALLDAGGFDPSLPVCSDYDLWLRLSLKYDFIAVDEPVFKRRRHSGNISRICFANRDTEFRVLENFYCNGGGKDVIPRPRAMKRLSKEQYRAGRSAIAELMAQTAREYLRESLDKYANLKSFLWLLVAKNNLYPGLRKQAGVERQKRISQLAAGNVPINQIKIAVDFNPVLVNKFSGFYTFGTGLLRGFAQLEEKPEMLLFHSNRYTARSQEVLKTEIEGVTQQATLAVKMRWLENFWNHFNCPNLQYFTGDFDIYHCLHHLMPPTYGVSKIMTVYDLRRYVLSDIYRKSKLVFFETAVQRADHFIAISESTKTDLCNVFDVPEDKVSVVPLASGLELVELSSGRKVEIKAQLSKRSGLELGDYLVVISSPDSRKNVQRTVEAFQIAAKRLGQEMKLLIIGQLPKREPEFISQLKSGKYKNVYCMGTVDELWPWLACARAFVFASLYEGFGIPVLEAFSCNVPVITSNNSSLPEVAGAAAVYVDPYDVESISEAIVKVVSDEKFAAELVSKGKTRNQKFTWKHTAKKTIEVYSKILGL